jgi:porin
MKKGDGKKLLLGVFTVFILFQVVASVTGSLRGEAGILVGLIVVIATLKVERKLFNKPVAHAARSIGLASPKTFGIIISVTIAGVMFLMVPLFAWVTGSSIEMYPNWQFLMVGLFFQAGIGEETLFRGYLFGHLRQQHTFGKAVFFAAIPFVLVHAILFFSLSWSLAVASILLAIAMSFPLSRLFEISGNTIWAPAVVHFAAQAIAKMFVVQGAHAGLYPFFCISATALVPLSVYLVPALMRQFKRFEIRRLATTGALILISIVGINAQNELAPVERADFWERKELTGDWSGERERIREKGVDVRFRITQAYQVGRDGAYSGKLDTQFRIDFEKLAGWKGLSVQIKTETRFGRIASADNGLPINAAVLSPKAAGTAFSVTAFNFTQLISIGKEKGNFIAVGAGKYYSLDSSREPFTGGAGVTRFMNIIANGNPAVGQTVPIVSNGATFALIRKGTRVVSFAVFDPVGSPTRVGIRKMFREGVTLVPGFSIPTKFGGRTGRQSFSGTVTTRKFTPFDQLAQFVIPGLPHTPIVRKGGSWSATYTFNQYIVEQKALDGSKSGWGIFGTFTAADATTNPVSKFLVFGVGGNGLFRNRQRDQFGVAYAIAGLSKKLKSVIQPVLAVRDERVGEAFYSFSLTPWMSLTGDIQIIQPVLRTSGIKVIPGARLVLDL